MAVQNSTKDKLISAIFWTFVFLQMFTGSYARKPPAPRLTEQELCQENPVDGCRRLGFQNISMSNIFGWNAAQIEIKEEIDRLMPLVDTGCSRDLLALICGAYLPACDNDTGERMAPCKDTCRKVVNQKCKGQMKRMGFKSERIFVCRNYPSRREEKRCITDLSIYRELETTPTTPTTPAWNITTTLESTMAPLEEPHVPSVIFTLERSASNDGWVLVKDPKPNLAPGLTGFEVIYYTSRGDDGGERVVLGEDQIHLNLSSDAGYTVLTRAVNQTDAGAFEDALMEPYVHPHCEEITYSTLRSLCSDVKYRHTQYTSGTGFGSQANAAGLIAPVEKLLRGGGTQCTDYMKQFLCTVYAPPCTRLGPEIDPMPPCRELCQQAADNCNADPTAGFASEMALLNCNDYPSIYNENSTCYSNQGEISLWPLSGGKGRVIKAEGDEVTAFCSSSCPNCTRPQWFDPNGMKITPDGTENSIKEVYSTNVGTFTSKLTIMSLNSTLTGEYICLFNNLEKTMSIELGDHHAEGKVTSNFTTTANVTTAANVSVMYNNVTVLANHTTRPRQNETGEGNTTETSTDDKQRNVTFILDEDRDSQDPSLMGTNETTTQSNITTPLVNATLPSATCSVNGTGGLLARSYVINDRGMTSFFRGWVDVQGQGAPNDFCRIVRTDGKPFLSCLLAGSMEDDLFAYTSPTPSEEWFDPGYSNTWYMKDEDGDGRDDYCRCIGSVPDTSVVCMKAGPEGFEGQEHDFTPEGSPMECFYLAADPYFGFP